MKFGFEKSKWFVVQSGVIAVLLNSVSSAAFAGSHSFINSQRSSIESHVFVSQEVEGSYGQKKTSSLDDVAETHFWSGFGFRNALGIEIMKFIQFSASHTFVNDRNRDNSLERLSGSRVAADLKLEFTSPIGNLEAGSGLTAARLDYQKQLDSASFYGTGMYYSLGLNYFVSSRVSVYGNARLYRDNMIKTGGSSEVENIRSNSTAVGFGVSLWL